MMIGLVLLAILFIAGLISTIFKIPTKKFTSWSQFLFTKASPKVVPVNSAMADKVEKSGSKAHDRDELNRVFATFDENKDGFITKQELKQSFEKIGIGMSEGEVEDMVEKVDCNGDGLIDFDEFCVLFESVVGGGGGGGAAAAGGGGEVDLKEAFDVFDGDKDGLISVEELGIVLSSLGMKEGYILENCKKMIRKVDMDGDGMVNFDEFKKMMRSGGRLVTVS